MAESIRNTVSGVIFDAFNAPLNNVAVQAYDKDLRSAQLLGEALSDAKGFYRISYEAKQYAASDDKTADVFIRISNTDKVLLAESPVHFNVPPSFTLDFKIDNTPIRELNEFDALVQKIKPLTEPQKVAIGDLQETDTFKDISFLANETGEDATKIGFLPIAFTLSGKTKIAPDIFYGLFRLQFPTDLNAILLIKSESIANGIHTAISENIISSKWLGQVDSMVKTLNELATVVILSGSDAKGTDFKQVIGAALPDKQMQQTFVAVYLANEKTPETFWQTLSQQAGFTDPKVIVGIQSVLKLNLLTNFQPALTTSLYKEQQHNADLKDIRGFASFSKDDWHARIAKLVSSGDLDTFPDSIEGTTPEEKAVNYASALTQLVKSLYPTSVFANRLAKDTSNAFKDTKTDLTKFFTNNADYDLQTNSPHRLFDESNLAGIADKERLKKELTIINLLYKITDDYIQVSPLRLDGITSATVMVNKYSSAQFAEKFAGSMTPETATSIYKKAQQIDNRSTVLALSIKMRNDIPIYAINGPTNDAPSDYVSMFGDTNCDCEHCQSVYSPSAYFVDILNILKKYHPDDAFKEFTTRRPDLIQILLTCKNTNTPLPYIDLVNELMEGIIAPIPPVTVNGVPTYPQYQTTNSANELLAYPEHVNTAAYTPLKTFMSAFNLPFNLSLEETRLYLDKLGVKRYGLMELYFGKQPNSKYNDLAIAAEYLQLSQEELDLVNGTTPMPVNLGKVTDFLRDTGLTYIEALQLLECHFVNPFVNPLVGEQRSLQIVAEPDADQTTCKIDELTLQATDQESLKVIPFIRLWKKTGWNIFDLDRAFTTLDVKDFSGDVNEKLIIPLSHIARLNTQFNLTVLNSITLWSQIDTAVYHDHSLEGQPKITTQYENLFQNKQVINPVDTDFNNPEDLSGTLAEKSNIVIAALNLSQKDFDSLNQTPFVNGQLSLQNLSVLFRHAVLAKALRMSVDDLISAIDLTGINPFGNSLQSADTLSFIDKLAFIRSSGYSLPELRRLLANGTADSQRIDINSIVKIFTLLREGLIKIELLEPVGATTEEQEANKQQNQNSFIADTLSTAFKTESKVLNVLMNRLVRSVADNTKPAITPFLDIGFISSQGPLFTIDSSNVITWIFPDLFNTYVILSDTWNRISKLMSKLKISSDEFIYFQRNEAALQISGIWNIPPPSSNLFPAFENLYNFVLFRNRLASPTPDWFTLFDFAILNGLDAKKNFISSLVGLSNLTSITIELLLGAATDVNDAGILKYAFPSDYLNGELLSRVTNCASMAAKLGSSVDNIAKLTIPKPTSDQEDVAAALAKSMLKSKYDVATWLSIIAPLSNQLRGKKRDALVSYILTSPETRNFRQNNDITGTNSLYAYFLIDVEMDACMITSRIKQAISSMQLYVDRCLMNLEGGMILSAEFTTQWNTWRKRYRVWEANRKVFLYPENWIKPAYRDDKSPFFKELESKLRQNEITADTAEDALRFYLEKLDSVANLEIVGVCPDSRTRIIHAVGRTRNIPHQYYYTKRIEGVWSAWEKIDVDIEGDHVLPVVWNNRLMLFWGVFSEKEDNSGGFAVPEAGGLILPAPKSIEIKLAWSEYKNGKWGSKNECKDVVNLDPIFKLNPNAISLSSFVDRENLCVRIFFDNNPNGSNGLIVNYDSHTFKFDGCHSALAVVPPDPDGLNLTNIIQRIHGIQLDEMFIREGSGKDTFSVLDTGIYKSYDPYAPGDSRETILFQNTPGNFQILPDHNEIEKAKPVTFFYSNERNNFYVQSLNRFKKHLFDEVVIPTGELFGELISRKVLRPLSPSDLPSDSSTKAGEKLWSASLSEGNEVVAALETIDFPAFSSIFIGRQYGFKMFYHPYTCEFIKILNTSGIDGLYKSAVLDTDGLLKDGIQNRTPKDIFIPNGAYNPTSVVANPYPVEQVDFNYSGVYSIYNWELFFHIPLLIATRLSENRKFDEARKWFHYIFDPTRFYSTTPAGTERFWITNPFKEEIKKGILSIEELVNTASPDLDLQLKNWEQNPFQPHAVARLRISAYMRSTVMKYIENLIAWGDQLFQQDTIESINEATLLYVLAANTLGNKPQRVPARAIPEENSFSTIQDRLDSFGNAKVAIQSFFSLSDVSNADSSADSVLMPLFCIPKNDLLLGYWDTVADRLFKIRHCLNIEGVFRQLPLFEPPIDPALLVRASAAGLDLSSVLNDVNVSLPNYRFQVMLQKANELCNDVKGLGSELLAALEKKDAEQLSLIRSSHELNMLEAVRDIKVSQRDEANENLDSLINSKNTIQARRDYYNGREFMNPSESVYFNLLPMAMDYQNMQIGSQSLATVAYAVPQVTIGPFASGATYGGVNIGNALTVAAASFGQIANVFNTIGTMANILGSFQRRKDDWNFQAQSAELELKQADKQIAAAEIRLAIAEKELVNHDLQRAQSKEVDDYLISKFTNDELYDYMVGEISSVYFQSYQLAYNTAKIAQKCFEFELGIDNASFIQFGYWDSLKKGLLSGEKLQLDLRRLENAYLEQNRREFELTKSISLLLLDPVALVNLREIGRCSITLPEEIFDLDYPGHYFRRIKSVSLSIPCVVGPYTSFSCTLRLGKNSIRINTDSGDNGYPRNTDAEGLPADDPRFIEKNNIPVKAIAASNAQNDSGVFELSFRDERYLPFEGTGAISEWSLELFNDNSPDFGKTLRQFDYSTISDVILHVKYTAREDAGAFKDSAVTNLRTHFTEDGATPSLRLFSLRQEFPGQWHRFLNPANPAEGNIFELQISSDLFRILDKDKTLTVNTVSLLARCADGEYNVDLTFPTGTNTMSLVKDPQLGLYVSNKTKQDTPPLADVTITPSASPITWQLKMTHPGGENLHIAEVEDVLLVLGYEWQ